MEVETRPAWIDPALELVKFDWISPSIGLIQCAWNGYGYAFRIPLGPVTGNEIVGYLHRHGIKTWAHAIDPWDESILFHVSSEDAKSACKLLRRVL